MVSKFIKRGTNKENVWEHGNIRQLWKGTREQGRPPPPEVPLFFVRSSRFSNVPKGRASGIIALGGGGQGK